MTDQPRDVDKMMGDIMEAGITHLNLKGTVVPIQQVLDEVAPVGERIKKIDLVGKPIVIVSLRPFIGQFGPALFVIFTDDNGEIFNTIVSNRVLMPKLLAVQDRLPVSCTIVKKENDQGGYYDVI